MSGIPACSGFIRLSQKHKCTFLLFNLCSQDIQLTETWMLKASNDLTMSRERQIFLLHPEKDKQQYPKSHPKLTWGRLWSVSKPHSFPVKNCRDTENPRQEVSGNHLQKMRFQKIQGHPNWILSTSSKGNSIPPLINLHQYLTLPKMKNHLSWLIRDDREGLGMLYLDGRV